MYLDFEAANNKLMALFLVNHQSIYFRNFESEKMQFFLLYLGMLSPFPRPRHVSIEITDLKYIIFLVLILFVVERIEMTRFGPV